jgi:S-adenosyl-L-methionine hydrolase (adenosine-forming)
VATRYEWISATTDYGTDDGFVAACVGVIARLAPHARVIDVTHTVPPGDIRRGATVLAHSVHYLPAAVHLAVVDPGVGTSRRGLAIVAGDSTLVGPDNGLLLPAADELGGVSAAYELAEPAYWLPTVSHTFHGRDVFAPVTAHLAAGADPAALGPALDVAGLVRLPPPRVDVRPAGLTAEVLTVDRFGNVQLAARTSDLASAGIRLGDPVTLTPGDAVTLTPGDPVTPSPGDPDPPATAVVGNTFADVEAGALVVLVDSAGHVAIAVNAGSAAARLATRPGAAVSLGLLRR